MFTEVRNRCFSSPSPLPSAPPPLCCSRNLLCPPSWDMGKRGQKCKQSLSIRLRRHSSCVVRANSSAVSVTDVWVLGYRVCSREPRHSSKSPLNFRIFRLISFVIFVKSRAYCFLRLLMNLNIRIINNFHLLICKNV